MNVFRRILRVLCAGAIFLLATTVQAGPSYEVFRDSLNVNGWSSEPWGATVTVASSPSTWGGKSAKVVYTSAMGVFKQVASGGFATTGYKHLVFAMYNGYKADDLWLVAETTGGQLGTYLRVADYADLGGTQSGKWAWVRIPIADLGLGSEPSLAYFSIASGKAYATAYFANVEFAASSVLYEGRAGVSATSHVYAPGIQFSIWHASRTYHKSDSNYWMEITPTSSTDWAKVQFQHRVGDLNTSDYGAVAIRFNPGNLIMSNQHMLTLTDRDGNNLGITVTLDGQYLPAGVTFESDQWYDLTIPMADFGISSQDVGGVTIETGSGESFLVDDVRLVQRFSWMIPGVTRNVPLDGGKFGSHWLTSYCDPGTNLNPKLHVGNDYYDEADSGRPIYAASRGFVKQVREQKDATETSWGWVVVLQHESGLTTSYLHLNEPALSVGNEVQRGALLGTTKYLEDENGDPSSHLHFGVRLADFDSVVSQAGALPKASCVINGNTYPAFSDRFIDSQRMTW